MSAANEPIGYLEASFAIYSRSALDPESTYIGPLFQIKADDEDCAPMDVSLTDYLDSQRWWL